MRNIDRVREFHETYKCAIGSEPTLKNVSPEAFLLRVNLIREELGELIGATILNDQVEILDALTDLEYVIDGTFIAFGFDEDLDWINTKEANEYTAKCFPKLLTFEGNINAIDTALMYLQFIYREKDEKDMWDKDTLYNSTKGYLHCLKFFLDTLFVTLKLSDVREDAAIEVHRSNMSKLGEDGKPIYRESDGKVLKGPNFFPPNLEQFING